MLFKKKKDINIIEAIDFIKSQKKINKENISKFKEYGFATTELEKWDYIYGNILEILKSVEKK